MLPTPENYAIFPSVVPAGKSVEMTIVSREKAFLFPEDSTYELTIIGTDNDEPNYYSPTVRQNLTVTAHQGVIRFAFEFEGEQEYVIKLKKDPQTKLAEFAIYSLKEDLYALTPLKGDFHSHSFRSDGKRDPAATAGHYREQAYDCYALTDHNRYFPGGEVDETYAGVDLEFLHIAGEEIHAPDSVIHIVHIGGKSSVANLYVHDLDGFRHETEEYLKKVPSDVPSKYAERYAKAMWATDKIHAAGGLAIFPHPFWRPGKSAINNVCSEFANILLKSGMFDAYELVGGMHQSEKTVSVGNNQSVALWGELRAEGVKIPVVGSSDVHKYEKASTFPHLFTICFAKERTTEAILEAIKAGNTVAVEATGNEYDRHYRCYGSLRLVTYAQFLLDQFYPKMQRICAGEGVAMRAYAIGEADKALIEMQAKQSRRFRARFFGKEPPALPSAEILEFEERWREVQRNGPQTKGGTIYAPPVTMQI